MEVSLDLVVFLSQRTLYEMLFICYSHDLNG